jgi:outer membrane protein assembly factor BamB
LAAALPLGVLLTLVLTVGAYGGNWPNWRGPFFNGSADETNLPAEWSTTENTVWTAELPGAGAATPIVWEDHVFISSSDPQQNRLLAMSFDLQSGQLRWRQDIAQGIRRDSRSNFAAPSPVTDGESVIFFYSNGDLVSFDFEGNKRWSRNIQKDYGTFAFLWTFSSSPQLYRGKLYVQVLQRDVAVDGRGFRDRMNESYLLALDAGTGEPLWQQPRASQARMESREAFTTPIPFTFDGRSEILVAGGDALTGHDPETGRELWRWGTWNPDRIPHWRLVPSPVAGDGVILACAPKSSPIYAVRAGGQGALTDQALAWVSTDQREVSSDVPTPAFYDGDFFVLSDVRKSLARVEPQTGNVKWSVQTPGRDKYEASPLAADGKIYIINFLGTVAVFNAEDGQLLHEIAMDTPTDDDPVRSSIAAAHGRLLVRTSSKLHCIGK